MTPLLSNYNFLLSYEIVVISEKFQNSCTLINSTQNLYTGYSSNSLTIMVYTSVSTGMSGHCLNFVSVACNNVTKL